MKKIVIILTVLLVSIGAFAQNESIKLKGDNTYASLSFDSGDTINASETYSIEIEANKPVPLTQSVRIKLDSISGTPTLGFSLYGKAFSSDGWTQIGSTVSWAGTSADTTAHIFNATANRYRFYKVDVVADAAVQTVAIDEFEFFVREE